MGPPVQIKGRLVDAIAAEYAQGNAWAMCKAGEAAAVVQLHPLGELHTVAADQAHCRVLPFWSASIMASIEAVHRSSPTEGSS